MPDDDRPDNPDLSTEETISLEGTPRHPAGGGSGPADDRSSPSTGTEGAAPGDDDETVVIPEPPGGEQHGTPSTTDSPPCRDDETVVSSSRAGAEDDETVVSGTGPAAAVPPEGAAVPRRPGDAAGVGSRYKLGRLLGEGGMGAVFTAADGQLGRHVAVKCLNEELGTIPDYRARFVDEAQIMAAIDHPGSVPVYDMGRLEDGRLYYSMKQLSGRTLKELLDERSPEQIESRGTMMHFVDVFERVCQTMAAAHADAVIHRDLKPDNVMVDDFSAVYVMDWGLAKRIEDERGDPDDSGRTQLGAVMGTPAYMSPELARGQAARSDCQTDVFSLGIILYEILTGKNPFRRTSSRESMKNVLHHDPDEPRKINKRVSRVLASICMKALAKDTGVRYADAGALAADIRAFREFRAVSALPPGAIDRLANWARRRPAVAAMTVTFLFVALLAGVAVSYQASVEAHMVGTAYEKMDGLTAEVEVLETEIDDLRATLADLPAGSARRQVLQKRLDLLSARHDVKEELAGGLAWAIAGLTIFASEDRARDLLRDDLVERLELAHQQRDWAHVRAIGEELLSGYESRNAFGFSTAEAERFRAWVAEADAVLEDTAR